MKGLIEQIKKLFIASEPSAETPENTAEETTEQNNLEIIRADNENMEAFRAQLKKIELGQKEVVMQLDTISEQLFGGESEENENLRVALMETMDLIEDLMRFTLTEPNSPYAEQARIMWKSAIRSAQESGIDVIDNENGNFDYKLHEVGGTDMCATLPSGCIIKTLKCGYLYKNEVLRRASVIVNKSGKDVQQ